MRFIKQFIYGLFYLAILGAIGYGVYQLALSYSPTCFDNRLNQGEIEVDCGGPCASCDIKRLNPIRDEIQTFGINGRTNTIITLVNPNIDWGAESFTYTINFKDRAGRSVFSLSRESFIYPAEAQKIIVEPNLSAAFLDIADTEFIISEPNWKPAEEFTKPRIQIRQVKTEVANNRATITGILANREAFKLTKATISGLVYQPLEGNDAKPVGASKTVVQDLQSFEERAFKLIIPLAGEFGRPDIDTLVVADAIR